MINDILYDQLTFIMEIPYANPGGVIIGSSLNNSVFEIKSMEVSTTFVT